MKFFSELSLTTQLAQLASLAELAELGPLSESRSLAGFDLKKAELISSAQQI